MEGKKLCCRINPLRVDHGPTRQEIMLINFSILFSFSAQESSFMFSLFYHPEAHF